MKIHEFMSAHAWAIGMSEDNSPTEEYDLFEDKDTFVEEYDLRGEFGLEEEEHIDKKRAFALRRWVRRDENGRFLPWKQDFEEYSNHKWWEYQEEHDHAGFLNSMDVLEACDAATFDSALKEYIEENKDEYKSEFWEYIRSMVKEWKVEFEDGDTDFGFRTWMARNDHPYKFKEWLTEEKEDELREKFNDDRTPDDYYPIWATAWEFPSGYTAEGLNDMGIPNLVFFDIRDHGTFVSLTACGMDLSPALEYAFAKYSTLGMDTDAINELLCNIQRSQLSYYKYVIGEERLKELMEIVGEELAKKADEVGRKKYAEFDERLKKLSELRDKGELDNTVTGLLGMMALFQSQECGLKEVSK